MLITKFLLFKISTQNKFNVCKTPKRGREARIMEKTNMLPYLSELLKHLVVVDFEVIGSDE